MYSVEVRLMNEHGRPVE